ncbi:cobalamin biosynthesis protein CbiX [Robbsia andropogonis]|uniref:Cobalamin biosynthesis protein CbiX n=1 Tax=Robbsia andropogonis TaxID=28092 RepID=A0A0F5K5Z1_9BURK|nr:CbiX/SirB N-terminal domain-containing protein [Robbsia andropogonis]KKB65370.1 cobalamin biosynthesis protein CbiX [Robbsia andropogonis]
MSRPGIILFGHGARDPRWAVPFERLAQRLRGVPDAPPVSLAFLELMSPDLGGAIDALVAEGCDTIKVVPVFFGQGAHLRRDLPVLLDQCRLTRPNVTLLCTQAAGEDDAVLDALAAYALRA